MNTRSLSTLLLAAMLAAPALARSTVELTPYAYPVAHVTGDNHQTVTVGSTEREVAAALGLPLRRASGSMWVYGWYHGSTSRLPKAQKCTLLVVTLENRRVVDLKLVNQRAANVMAAHADSGHAVTYVAPGSAPALARRP